jgi:hypothetical protein
MMVRSYRLMNSAHLGVGYILDRTDGHVIRQLILDIYFHIVFLQTWDL